MRLGLSVLVMTLIGMGFVSTAFASNEEIVLDDGRTGLATVLKTTQDSVSLEFIMKGNKVKVTLPATRLDAHCFYDIRRRHMEDTAENHLQLAVYCAKQGMWNRGQLQLDIAIALDEEYVEKLKATPGMREGIAESIIEAAKKWYGAGDVAKARQIAERVLARFGDTPVALQAQTLLGLIEEKRREQAAEKEAAELAAMDAEAKKEAAKLERAIKPLKATHELGEKLYDRAMKESNQSHSKRAYEAAANEFIKVLKGIDKLKVEVDPAQVDRAKRRIRADAVRALLKAGSIALHRGSWTDATKLGEKAQDVDPGNAAASAFLASIETAQAMDDTFDSRYQRRRGGPGRGGRR